MAGSKIISLLEISVWANAQRYLSREQKDPRSDAELLLAAELVELAAHKRISAGRLLRVQCLLAISVWLCRFVSESGDRSKSGSARDRPSVLRGS